MVSLGVLQPEARTFLRFPLPGETPSPAAWLQQHQVSAAVDAAVRARVALLGAADDDSGTVPPWNGHVVVQYYTQGAPCTPAAAGGSSVPFETRVLFACDPSLVFPQVAHVEYADGGCRATVVVASREACTLPQAQQPVRCAPTFDGVSGAGASLTYFAKHGGSILLSVRLPRVGLGERFVSSVTFVLSCGLLTPVGRS